jgi:phosphoribosylformimino-5-aminoimidazole carboxamide ribotide isomerase
LPARSREFVIAPAIDVLDGRCVRLAGGDPERIIVEGGDPVEAAASFVEQGAPLIHLVDLDGAFSGRPTPGLVGRIVAAAGATPVQVGGGYREPRSIGSALDDGAARVLAGTAALDPSFLAASAARWGDRFCPALDVRDGRVAVAGWQETSSVIAVDLARSCAEVGVVRLLVTNTTRDGSLAGPDLGLLEQVLSTADVDVIAAGGVSSLDDLRALRDIGCEGAVLGSALWKGVVSIEDALVLATAL